MNCFHMGQIRLERTKERDRLTGRTSASLRSALVSAPREILQEKALKTRRSLSPLSKNLGSKRAFGEKGIERALVGIDVDGSQT